MNMDLVNFKQMSSDAFFKVYRDQLNLIYIDGAHDYASVRVDLINSQPQVVENGILCGDNLERLVPSSRLLHHMALARRANFILGYFPGLTQPFGKVFPNIKHNNQSWLFPL